jgi:hypothetical protein
MMVEKIIVARFFKTVSGNEPVLSGGLENE